MPEFQKFYYELAQGNTKAQLAALFEMVGVSQVLYGTDYPYRDGAEVNERHRRLEVLRGRPARDRERDGEEASAETQDRVSAGPMAGSPAAILYSAAGGPHEFLPRQRPRRRRQIPVRCAEDGDRAAHRGPRRRLHGAARAAVDPVAHGRAVRVLRSFRADRVQVRQRPRRAPASAYRARHRHLPVRRRDHAPRQPRHRGADPARRGQLDDRRPRHRAFGAHRHRAPRQGRQPARLADVGRAAGGEGGDGAGFRASRGRRVSDGRGQRHLGARGGRRRLWPALAGRVRVRDAVRRCAR